MADKKEQKLATGEAQAKKNAEYDPDAANFELKDVKHETIVGYQEQVKK